MGMVRWIGWITLVSTAPALAEKSPATPSEEETPTPAVFEPDWFPNGQFAGFFWANEKGLYAEAGLEVTIRKFAFGNDGMGAVARGESAFGTGEAYILMQAMAKGEPLVVLGAVLQQSPAGYIHLASVEVHSAADLAGKRVGVHAYAEGLLPYFLKNAGLPPDAATAVPVHHHIEALLEGSLDLHQGYAIDEMIRLQAMTEQPVEIAFFEDLGLPMYSMLLYTSRDFLEQHPEKVKAFLEASAKGWIAALDDPETAAQIINGPFADERVDDAIIPAQVAALRPFVLPKNRPIFSLQKEKWDAMQEALRASGQIEKTVPFEDAVYPAAVAE